MKRLALVALLISAQALANDDARFEACRAKLKKANELDVLYGLDWKPPSPPKVTVGRTFFQIPIDAKEGFAETLNCFLMAGKEDECVNFPLLHWQTGKPIAQFKNCKLKMD